MLVVVLFQLLVLHRHLFGDFLANHALRQEAVFHLLLEVFIRHAALFLDVLLELLGVGDLGIGLNGGHLLGDVAVDVDVEILGLLGQDQLIDAVAQQVLLALGQLLFQFVADDAVGAQRLDELAAGAIEIAPGDDVAVALGDDLFHQIRWGARVGREQTEGAEHTA